MLLQLIYDIGQQASNFYIILSGRIDIWSHPPGSIRWAALHTTTVRLCRPHRMQHVSFFFIALQRISCTNAHLPALLQGRVMACGTRSSNCIHLSAVLERRPKSIVSVLRKGDTFGDQAIINQARHSTAASNASLLVVSQEVRRCRVCLDWCRCCIAMLHSM